MEPRQANLTPRDQFRSADEARPEMIKQAAVSSAVPPTSAPDTLSSTSQKYPITEEVAEKTADGQPHFKKMRTDEAAVRNTMVAIPVPNGKKDVPMNQPH
jgi:hypothetical protein